MGEPLLETACAFFVPVCDGFDGEDCCGDDEQR